MTMKCKECIFFRKSKVSPNTGECMYSAPVPGLVIDQKFGRPGTVSMRPAVSVDDYCAYYCPAGGK